MKILVFSWRDPKHYLAGGAEQVMHEHMKAWVKAGHSVTLFSAASDKLPKEETIDGVKIIRDGSQYLEVQIRGLLFYQKHKNEFDLVIDQFHGLPFFTPLYVRKPKIAIIQEPAREVWFLNHLVWPINLIVGLLGFLVEPFIFLIYKSVPFITGSESAKDDISFFGIPKNHVTVIPHGVLIEELRNIPEKEKEFTVTFLGVLSKDKGIEDAIETFNILKNIGDFQFWIIGKAETEEYEKKLKVLVRDLGLDKYITFWGFVSQREKFELLAKSHILINPSYREGWGLVNIEANFYATPIVAYPSRGLVDSVKSEMSGIICEEKTPLSLARAVARVYEDPQEFKKLSDGAKKWSHNFSWDSSVKLSLSLINKVVNES
ncbi:MAG: glycosyltransferase family 4 protein [Candidatus Daviesbacteria bacterium]|nr:glycosyltransferase family 4 protein [Candidatus Daviesbacteria bacterium]